MKQSNALPSAIELCEVFVIIGATEKNIRKELQERQPQASPDFVIINQKQNLFQEHKSALPFQCKPEILDSYPQIFSSKDNPISSNQGSPHGGAGKRNKDYSDNDGGLDFSTKNLSKVILESYLYLSNIQAICFPEGYQIDPEFQLSKLEDIIGRNTQKSGMGNNYKFMHFTITQACGTKKYLTSLQYKELALVRFRRKNELEQKKLCFIPKCMCIVSKLPIFSIQRQMLEYVHEDLIKKYHELFIAEYSPLEAMKDVEPKLKQIKHKAKLEKLEFYLSLFFHHLQMDGSNLELEIYKKYSDEASLVQKKKSVVKFVNSFNKDCLKLENYDFRLLFQKVKPKMLLQMFVCMLHERKIILIHNDSSKNALLIEALISLLYPLQWNFTNISYLIPCMVEYLEAPFPYIIGVPRDLWKQILEQKWDILGEEIVAFDLDNHIIHKKEDIPEFPQPYTSMLITQLERQMEKSRQISTNNRQSDEEKLKEEEMFWNTFTLKVKQQFLNFLIFLINTFENFYVNGTSSLQRLSPIKSMGVGQPNGTLSSTLESTLLNEVKKEGFQPFQGGSANDIFNFDDYLQNQRDNAGFFEKFVRTQAFINFIEQSYYEEQGNISDVSIRFFKECTRLLSMQNILAVRTLQDNIINGLIQKHQSKGITYSIDQCQKIYEKSLHKDASSSKVQENSFTLSDLLQSSQIGIINKLSSSKILKMTPFDPQPLIDNEQYRRIDSKYDIQEISHQKKKSKIKIMNNQYSDQCIDDAFFSKGVTNQPHSINVQDYFSAQITPSSKMYDSSKAQVVEKFNQTHQHIKIVEDLKEEDIKSPEQINRQYRHLSPNNIDLDEELMRASRVEEESGFMGFFKKTLSSVKKTFENTFKKPSSRNGIRSKTPYEESPGMNDEKQRSGNRGARSQTFHVSSSQQVQRDRKNNDSFFDNFRNLASSIGKEKVKEMAYEGTDAKLSQDEKRAKKRQQNGSGFFVFNEEDLKSMTEMSPKNKSSRVVFKPGEIECDLQEVQSANRQQPIIKGQNQFDYSNNSAMRIRSISYQNQNLAANLKNNSKVTIDKIKQMKLIDLMNESGSSIVDDNKIFNILNTPEISKDYSNSPIQKFKQTNLSNFKIDVHQQLSGVTTPKNNIQFNQINPSSNSTRKEQVQIKSEFEEVYKKSTEKLIYEIPIKNKEAGFNQKFNLWKPKSGRQEQKATKPPKAQQQTQQVRNGVGNEKYGKGKIQVSNAGKQARYFSNDRGKELVEEESKNQITFSENNTTEEDVRTPFLDQNIVSLKSQMMGLPFEKQTGKISFVQNANAKSIASQKHKRQLSQGNNSAASLQQQKGQGSPHENIEPDESRCEVQNNKRIENMQIGRIQKKPSNNNLTQKGSNQSSFAQKKNSLGINNQRSKFEKQLTKNMNPSNAPISQSKTGQNQTSNYLKQKSGLNAKEELKINSALLKQNIQAKTLQSSSNSNSQTSHESYSQPHNQEAGYIKPPSKEQPLQPTKIQDYSHLQKQHSQLDAVPSSKSIVLFQNQTNINKQSAVTKNSIDLRESKKGDVIKLHQNSQAEPQQFQILSHSQVRLLSPSSQPASQHVTATTKMTGNRIHSLSHYNDQNQHPNLANLQDLLNLKIVYDENDQEGKGRNQRFNGTSGMSAFREHIKPLNKIQTDAFNQIAKLSGDVDHEPSTPVSGGAISSEDEDEYFNS